MRKRAIFTVALMLISLLPSAQIAAKELKIEYYAQDFESFSENDSLPDSLSGDNRIVSKGGVLGKAAQIGLGGRWLPRLNTPIKGEILIEVDFMQETKGTVYAIIVPQSAGTSGTGYNTQNFPFEVNSDGVNINLVHGVKNGVARKASVLVKNYDAGTAYSLRFLINTEEKSLRTWVDGVECLTTEEKVFSGSDVPDVSRFNSQLAGGSEPYYIGKLRVSRYFQPSLLQNEIKEARLLYDAATVGAEIGMYPQKAKETFLKAITDAEAIYHAQGSFSIAEEINQAMKELELAKTVFLQSVNKEKYVVYWEDFESKTSSLTVIHGTPGVVEENGNYALRFSGDNAACRALTYLPQAELSEDVSLEISYLAESEGTTVHQILEVSDAPYALEDYAFVVSSDGVNINLQTKNGVEPLVSGYKTDTWYHFKFDMNIPAGTVMAYVNEKPAFDGEIRTFMGDRFLWLQRINSYRLPKNTGSYLLDNFRITTNLARPAKGVCEFLLLSEDELPLNGMLNGTQKLKARIHIDPEEFLTEADSAVVYLAGYDANGKFVRGSRETVSISSTAPFSKTFSFDSVGCHSVKAFLWEDDLIPLSQPLLAETKEADVILKESSGVSGPAFFRQGIPFAEGELINPESFYLTDADGNQPMLQREILQTYPDGSVRWMSVALTEELEAYETKPYFSLIGTHYRTQAAPIATEEDENIILSNGSLSVFVTQSGISDIRYLGQSVLRENGIRLSVTDSAKRYFRVTSVDLLRNGPVYAQVRMKGEFSGSNILGEWILYLYKGSNRITQEAKIIANGAVTLSEETFEFDLLPEFQSVSFEEKCESDGSLYCSDWAVCSGKNRYFALDSHDTERFRGSLGGIHNGFLWDADTSTLRFAPFQSGASFEWPDGVQRTFHLGMSFADSLSAATVAADGFVKRDTIFPTMQIAPYHYVEGGWLETDTQSEVMLRMDEAVASLHGQLWHTFEAGKIANSVFVDYNRRLMSVEAQNRSAGEVEYNLWKSYMNSQNPKLYALLRESSEHWSDIMMYHGENESLHGANRYMTGSYWNNNRQFAMTQPYYGDMSGMYLSYMMTGDPIFEEAFRQGVTFWEENIASFGLPVLSYWWSDLPQNYHDNDYQARFMAQVRGMALAYELYHDPAYLEAIYSVGRELGAYQNENGSFYEDFNRTTKEPLLHQQPDGQIAPNEKYYIMLMGGRLLAETYNRYPDENTLGICVKLADFLLGVMEEEGWYFQPNRNYSGDDRGCDGTTNSMAGAFFAELYRATGEEEYFEAMCKAFRFFTSQWNGGNSGRSMHTGISNYLYTFPKVAALLKEQKDLAIRLGFADLVGMVQSQTMMVKNYDPAFDTQNNRFSQNVYDTPYGRVMTLNHVTLSHKDTYNDVAFALDYQPDSTLYLWAGTENTVTADTVSIRKSVQNVDLIALIRTGISLNLERGEVTAEVKEYTPDRISLSLTGSTAVDLTLEDGFVSVKPGDCFDITMGDRSETVTAEEILRYQILLSGATTEITIERGFPEK